MVEDQMHFVFHCPLYNTYREDLYCKARALIPAWDNLTDTDKLIELFSEMPRNLGKYVKNAFVLRRRTLYN